MIVLKKKSVAWDPLAEKGEIGLHSRSTVEKTPLGRLKMHQRLHSSVSFRFMSTKALSLVRKAGSCPDNRARAGGRELARIVLHEEHLRGACLKDMVFLHVLASFLLKSIRGELHLLDGSGTPSLRDQRRLGTIP